MYATPPSVLNARHTSSAFAARGPSRIGACREATRARERAQRRACACKRRTRSAALVQRQLGERERSGLALSVFLRRPDDSPAAGARALRSFACAVQTRIHLGAAGSRVRPMPSRSTVAWLLLRRASGARTPDRLQRTRAPSAQLRREHGVAGSPRSCGCGACALACADVAASALRRAQQQRVAQQQRAPFGGSERSTGATAGRFRLPSGAQLWCGA